MEARIVSRFWRTRTSWAALALVAAAAFPFSVPAGEGPPAPSPAPSASAPQRMSFQGDLRDGTGTPLTGDYGMIFRLFDAPSGGTLLLTDSHSAAPGGPVDVAEGLFDTVLGGGQVIPGSYASLGEVFASLSAVWVEVQVGTETLSPRIQVTSAAYAQNARTLDGKSSSQFAAAAHSQDASTITTGTLPAVRGGTGLADPGAGGNLLTSNGSSWVSSPPPGAGATGAVVDAANPTLARSGSGTAADPYKLALNLGNANTWAGNQTFATAQVIGTLKDSSGNPGWSGQVLQSTETGMIWADLPSRNDGDWTIILNDLIPAVDGNVGIGTYPAPAFKLDVFSSVPLGAAIRGIGLDYGGQFFNADHTGSAHLGAPGRGIYASGNEMGGYFEDLSGSGRARVAYGDWGIEAEGITAGGHFKASDDSGYASVGAADRGIDAAGSEAGGYFRDSDDSGSAHVGWGNYGIEAHGNSAGGYFYDVNSSGKAYAGYGDRGIEAQGGEAGGHFEDSDPAHTGEAYLGYGHRGVEARGNEMGGHFQDLDGSGAASVAFGDRGIEAYGADAGGYFQDSDSSAYTLVAYGDLGIEAHGNGGGGYFKDHNNSGYAYLGYGNHGIEAYGTDAGGYFQDSDSGAYAYVGYGTTKITGTSAVSFVQNHPSEKEKVIVYACPEGDEVATYTRGTARLVNGEARVELGETFRWVTNPDIGLTAHLTPRGECNGLYAESLSTTEMVVRELYGGKSEAVFDYLVFGLRIGFEESSVVQEKQQESFIPSFKGHRERYAQHPDLRAFSALERFQGMEASVRGVAPESLDLSRARALKNAIHEYDPATDPPVDQLFRYGHGPEGPSGETAPGGIPSPSAPPAPPRGTAAGVSHSSGAARAAAAVAPEVLSPPSAPLELYPVCEPVEAGDVLADEAAHPGTLCLARIAGDPGVVGISTGIAPAEGEGGSEESSSLVPVAMHGIVSCKVDAGYGSIARHDLLVASPTPGRAMKAVNPAPGTVLGKALEPLEAGAGVIRVLVMLQ